MKPSWYRIVFGDLRWLPLWLVGVMHRCWVFTRYRSDFDALILASPERWMAQYSSVEALQAMPWLSMLYLQQSPPLPNLLMAWVVQWAPWPLGVAYTLIVLQALLTGCAAILLMRLADRLGIRPGWSLLLALVWWLNPDRLVLEYHSAGQQIYEPLTMVLLLSVAQVMLTGVERRRQAIWLGSLVAALALTRASFSYFALPLWLLVLVFGGLRSGGQRSWAPRRLLHMTFCFGLPVVLLHGGWALKNGWLHDHLRVATSTWAGGNAAAGLEQAGLGDAFVSHALAHGDSPSWFEAFLEQRGARPWALTWGDAESLLPQSSRLRDLAVQQRLQGLDRAENGARQRVLADEFLAAWRRFAADHPDLIWRKLRLGYALYWFPIRYHGSQEVGLFATEWRVERSFRVPTLLAQVAKGELPEPQLVTAGTWPQLTRKPADWYTLDLLVTLGWILQIVTLHLAMPIVAGRVLWRAIGKRTLGVRPAFYLFLVFVFGYSGLLHNLVEFGENMRFRMAVEPLLWLLTALTLGYCWRWLCRARRRRNQATTPHAATASSANAEVARPTTNDRGQ